jgi:serine/threonine protein kinase
VKPSNFLYDRVGRRYALVDFGLAQYQKDLTTSSSGGGATQAAAAGRGNKRKAEDLAESETTASGPVKKGSILFFSFYKQFW